MFSEENKAGWCDGKLERERWALEGSLASLQCRSQESKVEATHVSISGWMGYTKCSYYKMEYYSAIKRDGIVIHGTMWVSLNNIMLNEISQPKR